MSTRRFDERIRRARISIGRRGEFLSTLGLVEICYGIGNLFLPLPERPYTDALVHEMLPEWAKAALWIVCGVVAIAFATAKTGADRFGFMAALGMPGFIACSYLASSIIFCFSFGDIGTVRGIVSAVFYFGWIKMVLVVSGWAEPAPTAPPTVTMVDDE